MGHQFCAWMVHCFTKPMRNGKVKVLCVRVRIPTSPTPRGHRHGGERQHAPKVGHMPRVCSRASQSGTWVLLDLLEAPPKVSRTVTRTARFLVLGWLLLGFCYCM